jgi:hypothetical protein
MPTVERRPNAAYLRLQEQSRQNRHKVDVIYTAYKGKQEGRGADR